MRRLTQTLGAGLMLGPVLFSAPLAAGPLAGVEPQVFCGDRPFVQTDAGISATEPLIAHREVPAVPGARFGVSARAAAGPLTGVTLTVTRPAEGGMASESRAVSFSADSATARMIVLDTEDLRPGSWRIRATLGDVLLYEVSFELITPCPSTSCH